MAANIIASGLKLILGTSCSIILAIMLGKILIGIALIPLTISGLLLATGHPGLASSLVNIAFFLLLICVVINLIVAND